MEDIQTSPRYWSCNARVHVKEESLVIDDENASVNDQLSIVLTARQGLRGLCTVRILRLIEYIELVLDSILTD